MTNLFSCVVATVPAMSESESLSTDMNDDGTAPAALELEVQDPPNNSNEGEVGGWLDDVTNDEIPAIHAAILARGNPGTAPHDDANCDHLNWRTGQV